MLEAYLPALVLLFLGLVVGIAFTMGNRVLGPSRPNRVKPRHAYERLVDGAPPGCRALTIPGPVPGIAMLAS